MNVELKRIAEKKLEQMGATVHGVLARNEAGAWAAVSEAGRVMWLDNFEGQASSAQGEPSSGMPEWKERLTEIYRRESTRLGHELNNLRSEYHNRTAELETEIEDLQEELQRVRHQTAAPTPEAGQSGGAPVAWMNQRGEVITAEQKERLTKNQGIVGAATATNFKTPLYTNQPDSEQGGEWVRCDERLPTLGEIVIAKYEGVYPYRLVTFWQDYNLNPHFGLISEPDGKGSQPATHWKPTGLTRPQPPKSKEGES